MDPLVVFLLAVNFGFLLPLSGFLVYKYVVKSKSNEGEKAAVYNLPKNSKEVMLHNLINAITNRTETFDEQRETVHSMATRYKRLLEREVISKTGNVTQLFDRAPQDQIRKL